ncbi:MAG: type II toxin-antitoxin system RelE/ParE family toxin [Deltaproteobacteria bacterium]|nr:type II toxin-antitoxin system RelE/ParE family toxin [Deltaproteobacteria bacterium]
MSRVEIRRDHAAEQDLRDQYCFYEEHDIDLAERFLDAVEETCSIIATQPRMGSPRHFAAPELVGVRFLPVRVPRSPTPARRLG